MTRIPGYRNIVDPERGRSNKKSHPAIRATNQLKRRAYLSSDTRRIMTLIVDTHDSLGNALVTLARGSR